MKPMFAAAALIPAAVVLGGCAAVNSTPNPETSSSGLLYFMPKRDVLVTVTNTGGSISAVTAAASLSYADRGKVYLLEYQAHLLAKNSMDLDVSEAGLLTSSKANQTGDAVSALGGLGTLAGYVRGSNIATQADGAPAANVKAASSTDCAKAGTYTFLLPAADGRHTVCGDIDVKVERYGWSLGSLPSVGSGLGDGNAHAGVFYRTNLPYKVIISTTGIRSETVVHSPSESKDHFLPLARTVFANNDATVTLNNGAGVPSKYQQNTDGEGAALLKLPAAIAAPYFAAIGQVFTWRSGQRTGQANDLNSTVALELAKMKFERCLNAIEAKDADLIASLKCQGG
jgi:hypothetical protein